MQSCRRKKKILEQRFEKTDADYVKKFETSIHTGLEAAQKELAAAIESGDAKLKLKQTKELQLLLLRMQNLEQAKQVEKSNRLETCTTAEPTSSRPQMEEPIPDPKAEAWALKTHGLVLIKQ